MQVPREALVPEAIVQVGVSFHRALSLTASPVASVACINLTADMRR